MHRTPLILAVVAALAAAPLARGGAQNPPAPPPGNPAAAALPPGVDTTTTPLAIRPGDVVKIQVWGHDELSGEFPIDENYDLLYPLIGTINVRSMSVSQLRERLYHDLAQLFQRPFLTLTPLFRVAVLGEVYKPGLYNVDPTLTIYDLLALAGGPTRNANAKKLALIRGGANIRLSLEPAAIASSTLQELGVRSGDQLVVPRSFLTRDDLGLILQIANFLLLAYTVVRR
jgi:protein involved in polysaccharide export with SLBB domain